MMGHAPDLPRCELSSSSIWTPLNSIFFGQCIQDSDEEKSFHSQQKKWKRKTCPPKEKKLKREYIIYEYASSDSEASTSKEFDYADKYEHIITSRSASVIPEIDVSDANDSLDRRKRNIKSKRESLSEPGIKASDEYDDSDYEVRVKVKKMFDDYKSCSGPEVHASDELNSTDKEEGRVKMDDYKSCPELEAHISDELNSTDKEECINSDKLDINSSYKYEDLHYKGRVKMDDYKSCPELEAHISDELNSTDKEENDIHFEQSVVKYNKCTTNKSKSTEEWGMHSNDESSDEWETHSNRESSDEWETHSSSESSDEDYEVAAKKQINQKSKSAQLGEYEKMVQKNRDEKMAFIKSLKILEEKENFKAALETLKIKSNQKKRNNRRKIFRDLGNKIHQSTKDSYSLIDVDERTRRKTDKGIEKIRRHSVRQKCLRKKKGETFALSQSPKHYNESPSVLPFEEMLKQGHVYHDYISEVCSSEYKIPQLSDNDYVSHLKKMTLQESQMISHSSISSMAVHESQEKIIICAGNMNGEIIFWLVNSEFNCCAFQPHLRRISCLKFNPYSPNVLISSSVDGTVYYGDFEKKVFYQMFRAESCNHFDFLSPTSHLVAHGIGYVSIIDVRTRRTFEKRHKCNEDAVKTVSLHPVNKNYFISANQKGVVKLWDLRKLQNDPVIKVNCTGENLISSFFSPLTGNSVLVTMSDTICLLDSSSLNNEFKLKGSIKHGVGGTLPSQATWLPNTDDVFVVGSRSNPKRIGIFDDKLSNLFNFTDEQLSINVPVNAFHSSLPFLASASRGKTFIFAESE